MTPGADCVEVSIAPFANGTSQPDTATHARAAGRPSALPELRHCKSWPQLRTYFEGVYKELAKFTSPANERVDSDILIYQVPGGMLSNFRTQLKEQGMSDRFDEVVREIPVVREALGWIPLVTPTSQIVGTQAMMNVKFGRWKMICQPAQDIALGKYGTHSRNRSIRDCSPKSRKSPASKAITERPADLLPPALEKYRKQCAEKGLPTTDEIVVLFAMYPQQVEALFNPKPPVVVPPAPPSRAAPGRQRTRAHPLCHRQRPAPRGVGGNDG